MKKWIICGIMALLLGYGDVLPFEKVDAGQLCVVETLLVEQDDEGVILYSTVSQGCGKTIEEAARNMEEATPGRLFLRQVKRVIQCGGGRIDLLKMPEEIPTGAIIYVYPREAETLLENIEVIEQRLEAKEQRERNLPTLGNYQNWMLKEDGYEGT